MDHSQADVEVAARAVTVPPLAVEIGADDAVPQPHPALVHRAAASVDKAMVLIEGASHYYAGQPAQLKSALSSAALAWRRGVCS